MPHGSLQSSSCCKIVIWFPAATATRSPLGDINKDTCLLISLEERQYSLHFSLSLLTPYNKARKRISNNQKKKKKVKRKLIPTSKYQKTTNLERGDTIKRHVLKLHAPGLIEQKLSKIYNSNNELKIEMNKLACRDLKLDLLVDLWRVIGNVRPGSVMTCFVYDGSYGGLSLVHSITSFTSLRSVPRS